jgi:hypothetical protein
MTNYKRKKRTFITDSAVIYYDPKFYFEKGVISSIDKRRCPNGFTNDGSCIQIEITLPSNNIRRIGKGIWPETTALRMLVKIQQLEGSLSNPHELIKRSIGSKVVVRIDQFNRVDRLYFEGEFAD